MKKIKYILFALLFIATGCNIDRFPKSSINKDDIDKSPETYLPYVMNGCYASLKNWTDPMHRCGEYAGDNINIRGYSTDAFFEFISFIRTPDNYRLNSMWHDSYRVIANASNVIKTIEEGQSAFVDNNLAECYFMRGMMYFYLCRAFGRPYYDNPEKNLGVPIVNGTPDDIFGKLPNRATVAETYKQVIEDLENAERLFNDENKLSKIRGTKEATQALLSRVYLFMSGTYENPNVEYAKLAEKYATLVIESGKYELLGREQFMLYNTLTPENNAETIFAIKRKESEFTGGDYYYTIGGMYATIKGTGWGEMYSSEKYISMLNETGRNDWREESYNMVDARAAFISPNYEKKEGKTTPVFRFVRDTYDVKANLTESNLNSYNYEQLTLLNEGGKLYAVENAKVYTKEVDEKGNLKPEMVVVNGVSTAKTVEVKYELKPINEEQQTYYIEKYNTGNNQSPIYKRVEGMIDNKIVLNRNFPMFYVVKCSLEGNLLHLHSPVISRLGEVYLNRAEARAKMGKYADALEDLNKIRERSIVGGGYDNLDATNAAERIDKERQLELAYQAERSYDVFRNGKPLERKYPGAHNNLEVIPANDFRVIYFIPQKAINDYNGTLTQNPITN